MCIRRYGSCLGVIRRIWVLNMLLRLQHTTKDSGLILPFGIQLSPAPLQQTVIVLGLRGPLCLVYSASPLFVPRLFRIKVLLVHSKLRDAK